PYARCRFLRTMARQVGAGRTPPVAIDGLYRWRQRGLNRSGDSKRIQPRGRRTRSPPLQRGLAVDVLGGLLPVADLEFFEDVVDVILYGREREAQRLGDLLVAQALTDQAYDLGLAAR